jgi:hypothetical protein
LVTLNARLPAFYEGHSSLHAKGCIKRAVLPMGIAVGMLGIAWAGIPTTGQAWPNATDVSVNPNFHAYVFVIGGIQYFQIDDTAGHVQSAVGNAGGQYIVLLVGQYAQQVSTLQQTATALLLQAT